MRVTVARSGVPNVAVRGGGLSVSVRTTGAQGVPGPSSPKGVAVEWPANGEDVTMFWAPFVVAPAGARFVVHGDAGSAVSYELRYGPDRDAGGTLLASGTVVEGGAGEDVALAVAELPTDVWVWLVITGVAGRVREAFLSLWV